MMAEKQDNAVWEPRIVAFLCNWCSYAGADLAGIGRLQYPPNVRIVRVPCSGRVNPLYILKAFQEGADGILVSGCHPGDCHYREGNYYARRRFALLRNTIKTLGLDSDRLMLAWISASEGQRFGEVTNEFAKQIKKMGPNPMRKRISL